MRVAKRLKALCFTSATMRARSGMMFYARPLYDTPARRIFSKGESPVDELSLVDDSTLTLLRKKTPKKANRSSQRRAGGKCEE